MSRQFDAPVWSGLQRRLAAVEAYIPDPPAWRAPSDTEIANAGAVTLGTAFRSTPGPMSQRASLVRRLAIVVAILALAGTAIYVASRPDADLRTGPFGPLGVLRGSDGNTHGVLLPDGRVLIVSGTWSGMGIATGRADLWTPQGGLVTLEPPQTARVSPSLTLLLDGRVLVVGGYGGRFQYDSSAIASAEIWDPETGAFAPTGPMSTARVRHTATLLADGRVLITGGSGPAGPLRTAELWDPATGSFSSAGTMLVARADHASVLLPGGDVLVVGGGDTTRSEAGVREAWSPTTQLFSEDGRYLGRPSHVSTTRLLDGGVLAAGVFAAGDGFRGVSVYRPNTSMPEDSFLSRPREGHAATLLPDGDVLITGGMDQTAREPLDSVERWDAATGSFGVVAALVMAVAGHDALLLPDGRVLIVPDATGPDGFVSPFIYDPALPPATR